MNTRNIHPHWFVNEIYGIFTDTGEEWAWSGYAWIKVVDGSNFQYNHRMDVGVRHYAIRNGLTQSPTTQTKEATHD